MGVSCLILQLKHGTVIRRIHLEDYYFKGPLTDTIKFRRIVSSAGLEEGKDVFITYIVLPRILGNTVRASDTVCYGLEALPFEQHPDSTLRGAYIGVPDSIRWIRSTDGGSSWSNATGVYSNVGYAPPGLTQTTIYSRVIKSGVCDDTSNHVTVTVLDAITGNNISQDTMICDGGDPDILTGPVPGGGDTADRRYKWLERTEGGSWGEANGTSDQISYDPGMLYDTTYYRRVFFSGIQDACIDTSDILTIKVLNDITNNFINATATEICEGISIPGGIDASKPEDGDLVNYRFEWIESSDNAAWSTAGGSADQEDYDPGVFSDTIYYSRVVRTGPPLQDVCQDTSVSIKINVLPKIIGNNMITAPETICQGSKPGDLDASAPGLGPPLSFDFDYFWESRVEGAVWSVLSTDSIFSLDSLQEDTYFQRRVHYPIGTELCTSYTDSIKITVQDRITGNGISHHEGFVCKTYELEIDGTSNELTGGDGSYTYIYLDSEFGVDFDTIIRATDTDPDYAELDFQTERHFRRIVNSGECTNISSPLTIEVRELPQADLLLSDPATTIFCGGDTVKWIIDITNPAGDQAPPFAYELTYIPNEDSGSPLTGSINQDGDVIEDFPTSIGETQYSYTLTEIKDANNCSSPIADLDDTISITVYYSPEATILNSDEELCGDTVFLNAEISEEFYVKEWSAETTPSTADIDFGDDAGSDAAMAILDRSATDTVFVTFKWKLTIEGEGEAPTCSNDDAYTVIMYERPEADSVRLKKDEVTTFTAAKYDLAKWQRELNAGVGNWSLEEGDASLNGSMVSNMEKYTDYTFNWKLSNGACTA